MSDETPYHIEVESPSVHVAATPEVISPTNLAPSQTLVFASLFLAILVLAITVLISRRRSSYRGNALLLVGPSDSGKTAILSTLAYEHTFPTHTSIQTNSSVVTLTSAAKPLLVIDVPGHPRIRDQFKDHLLDAKAIAFIVDASTISRNGAAVAEHLHHILTSLTSLPPTHVAPALSIVAHKCDALKASSTATSEQLAINRVRSVLERELEKRRTSHVGGVGVESLGSEDEGSSELAGLDCTGGGEFKFEQWEGGEIVFLGTSVSVGKGPAPSDEKAGGHRGLVPLQEWLEELS